MYANAHTYHINSISVNSDQQTFLSADDLRINLWNLEVTDQSFNIVDIKPANMEDLTEVSIMMEPHKYGTLFLLVFAGYMVLCSQSHPWTCPCHRCKSG
jgi:hypothetical protein